VAAYAAGFVHGDCDKKSNSTYPVRLVVVEDSMASATAVDVEKTRLCFNNPGRTLARSGALSSELPRWNMCMFVIFFAIVAKFYTP